MKNSEKKPNNRTNEMNRSDKWKKDNFFEDKKMNYLFKLFQLLKTIVNVYHALW